MGLDVGLVLRVPEFMVLLPIGISFYTFQSMSYTIDVYRGRLRPTRDPFHFFAYLSLFPQLVAGPIVRASDLLPQLLENRRPTEAERWEGLRLIVHGYFKKVVIADNLAIAVNRGFMMAGIDEPSCLFWWTIVTMFAFQIYCDFSGYSDIARGLARWMGYSLQRNFDHPYIAASMREFWARWHISLSTWFRDYVYIPLGGSRCTPGQGDRNLAVTMLLSGLWHGAAWRFVIWGAVHAVFLKVERVTDWPRRVLSIRGGRHLATILTLAQVWVGWVFFRAETMTDALVILKAMFTFSGGSFPLSPVALTVLTVATLRELYFYFRLDGAVFPASLRLRRVLQPVVLALMIVACVYLRGRGNEFIYFQF